MSNSINTMPAHLPPSMIDSVKLLPKHERLILFTRHSLREMSDKVECWRSLGGVGWLPT
jgi:hypothetical protein